MIKRIFRKVTKVEEEEYWINVSPTHKRKAIRVRTYLEPCNHVVVSNKIEKKRRNRKTARCEYCEEIEYNKLVK